jgi:hypothetical protein
VDVSHGDVDALMDAQTHLGDPCALGYVSASVISADVLKAFCKSFAVGQPVDAKVRR